MRLNVLFHIFTSHRDFFCCKVAVQVFWYFPTVLPDSLKLICSSLHSGYYSTWSSLSNQQLLKCTIIFSLGKKPQKTVIVIVERFHLLECKIHSNCREANMWNSWALVLKKQYSPLSNICCKYRVFLLRYEICLLQNYAPKEKNVEKIGSRFIFQNIL